MVSFSDNSFNEGCKRKSHLKLVAVANARKSRSNTAPTFRAHVLNQLSLVLKEDITPFETMSKLAQIRTKSGIG